MSSVLLHARPRLRMRPIAPPRASCLDVDEILRPGSLARTMNDDRLR